MEIYIVPADQLLTLYKTAYTQWRRSRKSEFPGDAETMMRVCYFSALSLMVVPTFSEYPISPIPLKGISSCDYLTAESEHHEILGEMPTTFSVISILPRPPQFVIILATLALLLLQLQAQVTL